MLFFFLNKMGVVSVARVAVTSALAGSMFTVSMTHCCVIHTGLVITDVSCPSLEVRCDEVLLYCVRLQSVPVSRRRPRK